MSTPQQPTGSALTRESILRALQTLSDELGKQGVTGEVCLFGGTVMVLAFTARLTTKDVDALFQPTQIIRELARRIATDQHCRLIGSTTASKISFPHGTKQRSEISRSFRICV